MKFRGQCLLALLVICMSGSAAAAKAAHPLAGTYVSSGDVYGYTLVLKISSLGAVSGAWGLDMDGCWISGRISTDGFLSMTLKWNAKGFTDRIKAIGELWLNESGDLAGYIQFEGREPQAVILIRQQW